jgi:hypothetical protein
MAHQILPATRKASAAQTHLPKLPVAAGVRTLPGSRAPTGLGFARNLTILTGLPPLQARPHQIGTSLGPSQEALI